MATQPGTTVTVSRDQVNWAIQYLEAWDTNVEDFDADTHAPTAKFCKALQILSAVSITSFELQARVNKLETFVRSQHPGLLECDQDIESLLNWAGG